MNINNSLEKVAESFSSVVNHAVEATQDKALTDSVQALSNELIQCANQHNPVNACSTMFDRASKLYNLSIYKIDDKSQKEVDERFETLVKLAFSVIHEKFLEEQDDVQWLLQFLKLEEHFQSKLISDPQIAQRLKSIIWKVGPNQLVIPESGVTLFLWLASDKNPGIRILTFDLLKHPEINLKQTNNKGNTALHEAAKNNDSPLLRALLDSGSDPLQRNKKGKIPYEFAETFDSREVFFKCIPFDLIINGKPFINHTIEQISRSFWLPETLDITPIVEYIKNHSIDKRCLETLFNSNFLLFALAEQGYLIDGIPEENFANLCSYCIKNEKIEGLRTILNAGRLPFQDIEKTDFFSAIEAKNELAIALKKELKKAKDALSDDSLRAYQSLAKNLVTIPGLDTRRAIKMDEIDRGFQKLIENQVPGAENAKRKFDSVEFNLKQRENLAKARQIFEQKVGVENKARKALEMGLEVFVLLKHLAWIDNDDALLTELERYLGISFDLKDKFGEEVHAMNKVIANVALDKMYFAEKKDFSSGKQNWIAPYFANALMTTQLKLEESSLSKTLEPAQKTLRQCIAELQQQTRWAEYGAGRKLYLDSDYDANRLIQSKDLVEKINALPIGQGCLVPVAIIGHATLMRIENSGEGKVRVFYYNTGQGVIGNHSEGKKNNTYQTFIEYRDVPIGNLQDPEVWTQLTEGQLPDMAAIYKLIEKLCSGGVKQPQSPHEEFYEAIQKSGSCAYQCFLAMIRERLVSSLPNPVEGLGLYKVVKGIMIQAFEERTRAFRNQKINEKFQSKLKVIDAELSIVNAIVDPSKREILLKELSTELRAHHLEALAEEIEYSDRAPSLVLFPIIRRAIKELTALDAPLTQNGLAKELIMARREKDAMSNKEYKEILDDYLNDQTSERLDNWLKAFATQYFGGEFQSTALNWAVNRLNRVPKDLNDKDPGAVLLNKFITGINKIDFQERVSLISPLIDGYKKARNHEMVAYLQSSCLVQEKQQGPTGFEY